MMSHNHDHNVRRGAGEGTAQKALWVALAITASFMVLEAIGGWIAGSLALLADAGHMLTDASSLGLAIAAGWFARRAATQRRSYGWHRMEILAAFLNGIALVVLSVLICAEAVDRFSKPQPVKGPLMLGVAALGLLANIGSGLILFRASHTSLNARGAFVHVMSDMLGSVGALIAGILIMTKGWYVADPIIGLVVSVLVLFSSWSLIRESVSILLESTPRHIDTEMMMQEILKSRGVASAHDLHIWTMTSGYLVLTLHVVLDASIAGDAVIHELSEFFEHEYGITHCTIQVENVCRPECLELHA